MAIARCNGEKSCERARFGNERTLFVRIVVFRQVLARAFDVLHRVNQVAVGNHRMMGRFFEFSGAVVFGGAALVFSGMLQELRSFQMMIHALLRHIFRIANAVQSEPFEGDPPYLLLDDGEIAVLASQVELVTFEERQRINEMDDPDGLAYVMVKGEVRVTTVDADNQEVDRR